MCGHFARRRLTLTGVIRQQEGSIVRCITRLDELCREVRNAARIIGDPTLYRKMEQASESIKRDIVFAVRLRGFVGLVVVVRGACSDSPV